MVDAKSNLDGSSSSPYFRPPERTGEGGPQPANGEAWSKLALKRPPIEATRGRSSGDVVSAAGTCSGRLPKEGRWIIDVVTVKSLS